MKLKYDLTYDGKLSRVTVAKLEGERIQQRPAGICGDCDYLDTKRFRYTAGFVPQDSDVFTTIEIQKNCGENQSGRAAEGCKKLTRKEADGIIGSIIRTTLGTGDFELETDSADFEENEGSACEAERKSVGELKEDITNILSNAEDDYGELNEYLEKYGGVSSYDIRDYAFREAIRLNKLEYVDQNIFKFDLNDMGGYSSYIYETEDKEMIDYLMQHGACKSVEEYDDCKFAMESENGTIISFDPNFQRVVFKKYLKEFGITKETIIMCLSGEEYDEENDFDRDIIDDMSSLGVFLENGKLSFMDMWGEYGEGTRELLEELGWDCEFEGDSWGMDRCGTYFIE